MDKITIVKNNKSIDLPYKRVFYAVVDGKVGLYIANEDFTKFRSFEQFVENNGETEIKAIKMTGTKEEPGIVDKLHALRDKYYNMYAKLRIYKKRTGTFEKRKNLKPEKIDLYDKMEDKREKEANEIIGDANEYWEKNDCYLSTSGEFTYHNVLFSHHYGPTEYFLPTREILTQSSGSILFKGIYDHGYNFLSFYDLEYYREEKQKEYDREISRKKRNEEREENNEKYLKF